MSWAAVAGSRPRSTRAQLAARCSHAYPMPTRTAQTTTDHKETPQ